MKVALLSSSVAFLCFSISAFAEEAVAKNEVGIRALIEGLVFVHEKASDAILISPGMTEDADKEYERQNDAD